MKKIMAILLSIALLLGCAAGLAEAGEKQSLGTISVNGEFTLKGLIPEGYRVVPFELDDNAILTQIVSDDRTRPQMILSIGFDELYADVERLNDVDDDTLATLEETFTVTDPYAVITYDETAYGTRLLVCRTLSEYSDYLDIMSIYKGYLVEFVMVPGPEAAEQKLTDEQIRSCTDFLSELDFVTGAEEEEIAVAGAGYEALITGYDAEAKTIDITLLLPYTFTEWQLVSINEGDTIRIGEEDVEIGTLEYGDDDSVDINDEYEFNRNANGLYTATLYEMPVMRNVKELTAAVPDSLKFIENVDPESGELLDEAAEKTAEDLFAALEIAENGGIAFDSQNVVVLFDENGDLAEITRFYAPWQ
ncbi:MAG: hypothetical protein K6E17_05550 [Clostridiales bacterium]|nr:hypothetical protein [Clostridiales bacterium]